MMQHFDNITVDNDLLILQNGNQKINCKIIKNKELIKSYFENQNINSALLTLTNLTNLYIIDYEKKNEKLNKINDLVFALYFNLEASNLEDISEICKENKCYNYLIDNNLFN